MHCTLILVQRNSSGKKLRDPVTTNGDRIVTQFAALNIAPMGSSDHPLWSADSRHAYTYDMNQDAHEYHRKKEIVTNKPYVPKNAAIHLVYLFSNISELLPDGIEAIYYGPK